MVLGQEVRVVSLMIVMLREPDRSTLVGVCLTDQMQTGPIVELRSSE